MKLKIPELRIYRLIVQLIFLLLMPYLFTLTFDGIRAVFIDVIHWNFDIKILFPKLLAVATIVPLTILSGRFFCGWMCAFGTAGDLAHMISSAVFKRKNKIRISPKADHYLKFFKYIVLAANVYYIWILSISPLSALSPWDAFGRMPDLAAAFKGFLAGFVVLTAVMFISMFIERFFCRYMCPLGAVFAGLSKIRILKIRKNREGCGKCRACTNGCPMGIPLYEQDLVKSGECIDCMECISVCPRKNSGLTVLNSDLNPLLASAVVVASITGVHFLADLSQSMVYGVRGNTGDNYTSDSNNNGSQKYADGTYNGVAEGYRPGLNVSVSVKDDRIVSIVIGANNEERGYREAPFNIIPQRIIQAQSANVVVVSGATYSSTGIMDAVRDALNKALINNVISNTAPAAEPAGTMDPGTDLATDPTTDPTTNPTTEPPVIVSQDSPAVTPGLTTTPPVTDIKNAGDGYRNGSYTGSGDGYCSQINVTVNIVNNRIDTVVIDSQRESKPKKSLKAMPERIVDAQSADVAVVSGATYTSRGILDAVRDALSKARAD